MKSDLGTRDVERHFVPVLPQTHDDFIATFLTENDAVVWRVSTEDKFHGVLSVRPGEQISFYARHSDYEGVLPHARGGTYLSLHVTKAQMAHWEGFIDKYTPAGETPFAGGDPYRVAMTAARKPGHGHCMWWMVNGEVAPDVNVATHMGVRRAQSPDVLGPRLIHAGNERAGPVGIAVKSIAEFNAMSDQQLLGPEPAGGAAEQVKE